MIDIPYRSENRPEGGIRAVLIINAILVLGVGWGFGIAGLLSDEFGGLRRLILLPVFFVLVGSLVPLWLATMKSVATVVSDEVRARIFPFRAKVVGFDQIERVSVVPVDAFRDFSGVGIKGSARHRLYGFSGIQGVEIAYRHADEERTLTILADDADELASAIGAGADSRR